MPSTTAGLSTPAVFRELDAGRAAGRYPAPDAALQVPQELIDLLTSAEPLQKRLAAIAGLLRNDLAAPAIELLPELAETLKQAEAQFGVAAGFVSGGRTYHSAYLQHISGRKTGQI